ncbi:MAG: ABC transporter substrate-binding protein [Solirubrobacteraceae bacterium]
MCLAIVAGALALAAAGCGDDESPAAKAGATDTSPATVRSCGSPVTAEDVPRRVVATAVGLTDTLYALGVGNRLIGVGSTDYATPSPTYAAEFSKVASLGKTGTGAKELVLSKEPDLVYAEDGAYPFDAKSGRATIAELDAAGAAVYVSAQGCDGAQGPLAGVYSDVENLGALLRVPDRARALVAQLRKRVADAKGLLAGRRMRVAILGTGEGNTDLYAIGPAYTQGAMLTELGQVNAFGDLKPNFTKINPEEVVRRNPEAIFMGSGGSSATERRNLAYAREKFKNTTAVREGRVHLVEDAGGTPGSVRQVDQVVQMARDLAAAR